jgi:predicted DNA-binding antitoxin AbrB/MazE fold protein
MTLSVSAIYENGVFRPTSPVPDLRNGTSVVLTVQPSGQPANEREDRSLTPKELRALIRSKNPGGDTAPEEWFEEIERLIQMACIHVRDPETMRQAAERMDKLGEQIYKREGLLDIVMPLLRESRDEE